ncbi:hypothetical protein BJ085DRAFT_31928 [Dimargaris cristalligena]|uniref:Ubiquitin-like domain-containing protein n=1 Tax=Dimargaris cristalligena TaxID=215637 RepID=A0A4P9ZVP0_9FUNG|nr:hypothetical protein BJ085DRAFT_31928 [Dimargaris cristalligena]|eukprot:RKP37653.1 hypothetical protein BJ085DRAFT_31928 [Dimargaris cristalligena]
MALHAPKGALDAAWPIRLRIRFNDTQPDLYLATTADASVNQVKNEISVLRPPLASKQLRLIFSGQLLRPDTQLIDYPSLRSQINQKAQSAAPPPASTPATVPGGPISDAPEPADLPAESTTQQDSASNHNRPVGFDRLREAGFSEQDIANFRQQFHLFQGTNANAETWMDDGGQNAAVDGVNGESYNQLFNGLIVGFFLGMLSALWYRENMSPQHKAGSEASQGVLPLMGLVLDTGGAVRREFKCSVLMNVG